MPLSSIPRISRPRAEPEKKMSPFLMAFLTVLLALYIGCISYWLIADDQPQAEPATAPAAHLQTDATTPVE